MIAGGRYSRKTMPGGIFWDAGDSPRGAFGACQDARGRRNRHVYDSIVGSEQSLDLWDIYTRSAGILTGISSLFGFMTIFFVCTKFLYRIHNFYGDCPGQVVQNNYAVFFILELLLEAPA